MRRRVVISGMGILSCAGGDLAEFRQNVTRGVCCLTQIQDPRAAHLRTRYVGLLHGDAEARLQIEPGLEGFDRFVHMALVAARETLAAARIQPAEWGRRLGLIFATCSGPMLLIEEHYERILRGDGRLTSAQLFAKRYHSGAKVLAHALGIQGFNTTVVTACSASTAAMALAADLIRCGMLDAALAGGSDAFATSTLAGFEGLKATCEGKCAPFSKPFGLNLGEAAGFVFLETPEAAAARGASVHAELLGSGMSNDAYHCSTPEPAGRGLAGAMKRALADAGLLPEQIAYVNAHGTGTEANDKAETKALRKVFGSQAERLPVSSTKSMVGHCLGAAGTVETIASIVCAQSGVLPPTANFTEPREGCALDCVPDAARAWRGARVFMSNNSAFGGHNASVVVEVINEPSNGLQSTMASNLKSPSNRTEPIYVTACGLVSSLGVGGNVIRNAEQEGRTGISLFSAPGISDTRAGMVNEAAVERFDRRLDLHGMDRSSRWATVAARAAIREARFPEKPATLEELGLFLSLAAGPSWAESEFLTSFLANNRRVQHLAAFPYIVHSSVAGNVCRALRLAGHNLTISAGPGAGLLGLAAAVASLRAGQVDAVLSGAVDELTERILADHHAAGLFSKNGNLSPGEGAAILMLETADHARAQGATPLAELCGLACSTEVHRTNAADDSLVSLEGVIREAFNQAGITPVQVSVVCADAPSARVEGIATQLCPLWLRRREGVARLTGQMEGAQILADLETVWRKPLDPDSTGYVLGFVSSPQGLNCAAIFKRAVQNG